MVFTWRNVSCLSAKSLRKNLRALCVSEGPACRVRPEGPAYQVRGRQVAPDTLAPQNPRRKLAKSLRFATLRDTFDFAPWYCPL